MILKNIEFYLDGARRNIILHDLTSNDISIFDENEIEMLNLLYYKIKNDYPEAYQALHDLYYPGANYRFRMVARFIRCNFYLNDKNPDIDEFGLFILEDTPCPLKNSGFCDHFNVICNAKLSQTISDREKEIATLLADGFSPEEVAERLYISPNTVKNHRRNIYQKLNIHSVADLLRYCIKQNWL